MLLLPGGFWKFLTGYLIWKSRRSLFYDSVVLWILLFNSLDGCNTSRVKSGVESSALKGTVGGAVRVRGAPGCWEGIPGGQPERIPCGERSCETLLYLPSIKALLNGAVLRFGLGLGHLLRCQDSNCEWILHCLSPGSRVCTASTGVIISVQALRCSFNTWMLSVLHSCNCKSI